MKQTVILNIHDTSGSIRDLIVMTSLSILVIVQERFEKVTRTNMYDGRPQDRKNVIFSNLLCVIESNFTVFQLKKSQFRLSQNNGYVK
jgi:hypothetical protein